jgi:hypothetical protein
MTAATASASSDPRTLFAAARFFFRHGSPRILAGLWSLTLLARSLAGPLSWVDGAIALGILLWWPINEWLIHVFILHYRPRRLFGRTLDFAVPRSHRAHHRDPRDLEILFIPLQSFAYTLPLLYGSAWLLAPTPALALTGVLVYLGFALHYEWVHFLTHTRYRARTRFYQRLFRNHRLHHYKNEHYWYGVSLLGADRPLGTAPEPDAVPTSETARSLPDSPLAVGSG